jgi:hypothetical protein
MRRNALVEKQSDAPLGGRLLVALISWLPRESSPTGRGAAIKREGSNRCGRERRPLSTRRQGRCGAATNGSLWP